MRMSSRQIFPTGAFLIALSILAEGYVLTATPAMAQTSIFICSKPGNEYQLQFKSGPGCEPLVDAEREAKKQAGDITVKRAITADNLEAETTAWSRRYRDLMACCASNLDSYQDIDALEGQASDILREAEKVIGGRFSVLASYRGLIIPVAQGRERLRAVKQQMEQLAEAKQQLGSQDYEAAGRLRRDIQQAEDALQREYGTVPEPRRAPTGTAIGQQQPTGAAIGSSAPTGTDIGQTPTTGPGIGTSPPTLPNIIDVPPTERTGSMSTTKPASTGTVGPDIGTTPPTGQDIGDSSLNR